MKLTLLTLALCLPAFATQITDSDIRDAAGHKILSGVLKICPPGAFASGSWWISADCVTASIASGLINVSLVPGHYYVHWQSPAHDDQRWFVPDSGTPLRIADAITSSGWPLIALPPLTGNGVLKDSGGALELITGAPTDFVQVGGTSAPAVASFNARTGAITPQTGDYNTSQITESGSLYFTNPRALSALAGLYEAPLTFSGLLTRSGNIITCPTCGAGSASTAWGSLGGTLASQTDLAAALALKPGAATTGGAAKIAAFFTNLLASAAGSYCITSDGAGGLTVSTTGCPGTGGGGGALTLSALTNSTLASLTNSTLLTMGN